MTETVFTAIKGAIERKRISGKAPLVLTVMELKQELIEFCEIGEIKTALKLLYESKRVKIGRTINDHYIYPIQ